MIDALIFRNLSFSYETASRPLFDGLNVHFPNGWTGVVGSNGAGKTTLLKLATGILLPQGGSVNAPKGAIYCSQRTDSIPAEFLRFMSSSRGAARKLQGMLAIKADWIDRWDTLSHGERKRAQISVALWLEPEVLAVDEPTNHLDAYARELLASALQAYRNVGILVSHDRELLDSLCTQCLFLEPSVTVMRSGSYTQGSQQAKKERMYARDRYHQARQEVTRLRREAARRRDKASRAERMLSKRNLTRRDSDAREKIDRARVSGKDRAAGKLLRQMQGRLRQAEQGLRCISVGKEHRMGFWFPGSCAKRDTLFSLPASELPLGLNRKLIYPELVMRPADRIALTGPNGGGKSTIVRFIVHSLDLHEEKVVYVPQEIELDRAQEFLEQARLLPRSELGHLMTVISGLGSGPERLLESHEPSPGEIRKLLLAMGVVRQPHLIIMDEPTNHLDLPSIELLEQALAGCPCGMLLVSHDKRFLQATTSRRWVVTHRTTGELFISEE